MHALEEEVCARFSGKRDKDKRVVAHLNGVNKEFHNSNPLLNDADMVFLKILFNTAQNPNRGLERQLGLNPRELKTGNDLPPIIRGMIDLWYKEPNPNRAMERDLGLKPGELNPMTKEEADKFAEICLKITYIGPVYEVQTGKSLLSGEETSKLKALFDAAEMTGIYYTLGKVGDVFDAMTRAAGDYTTTPTQQGIDSINNHLNSNGMISAENSAMIKRIQNSLNNGNVITGADANFYLHELKEASLMQGGMPYSAAHQAALNFYGISPYSLYDPTVIQQLPDVFNSNWFNYWEIK